MNFVRDVEAVLRTAGDPELVHLWRRSCRELSVSPRLAVIGLSAAEAAQALPSLEGLGAAAMGIDPSPDEPHLEEAARDPLLGVHGVVWTTQATQPLGERERRALSLILRDAKPALAWVWLRGVDLLDKLSDDPEAERAQILDRLRALVPAPVQILDPSEVSSLAKALRARHRPLTHERQAIVAQILLSQARQRLDADREHTRAAVARLEAALAEEDEALDKARTAGRRAATYTLGAVTTHTHTVRSRVRDFLLELEADLEAQIASVADVETARRVLPHWIEHVVRLHLQDQITAWRRVVHAEVSKIDASDRALAHAELLMPPIHPSPFPVQGRWRRAVGLSAGVGGAVLLATLQLWIPAALAAAGGVAWSVIDRDPQDAQRDRLVDRARRAVRDLSSDIDKVLGTQIQGFEQALAQLGDHEAERLAADRAEVRDALKARLRQHQGRLEQLESSIASFQSQQQALAPTEAS
ncbi:MAG: hypothetical protein EA397_05485 [Deltaproteobacteria bacterium]|nr:MAG: hypothetical protein EA397_05485 [Deltaproteobacteria bacterium]